MDAAPVLPNLFVIGAGKAGTTSLHHYLAAHPEVSMTSEKEPMLFAGPDYASRMHEYTALLDRAARVRGESSTTYSQHPHWPSIPERIRARVPEARFVYLVRDPVERSLAHYRQHVRDGKESRPAAEALADLDREDSLYLAPSRYATQLELYRAHFPAERIRVVDSDELRLATERTMRRLFEFLGVDPAFTSPEFDRLRNTREELRRPTRLGAALRRTRLHEVARGVPVRGSIRDRARRLASRPIGVAIPPQLRDAIAAELRPEAERLREQTGLELGGWSV